ncbi:heavy metal translocating P-type ATPase [Candidatus Neomarinimicrobiota bacterium]
MDQQNKIKLNIKGMHCAGCVANVEKALQNVAGVDQAIVNLTLENAIVTGKANPAVLLKAVQDVGYTASEQRENDKQEDDLSLRVESNLKQAQQKMRLSWFITIPVMAWMLIEMLFQIAWPSELIYHSGMVIMAALVLFIPGFSTLKSGWMSARFRKPNMDVLISLGSLSALLTGVLKVAALTGYFFPIHSFAGIAGMIMAFHLTGRFIEAKARGRSSTAIQKLVKISAKKAVIIEAGQEKEIDIDSVQVGHVMIIKAGQKIPTDGVIVEGTAAVNESMVTGEPLPVTKRIGGEVIGGTICLDGTLQVRASKIGKDTFLAQVIKMVTEAQTTKVPIQIFADRIVAVFVPIILLLAIITFITWMAFPSGMQNIALLFSNIFPWINTDIQPLGMAIYAMIAVLVIACPCALGLATPTALMAGSGKGAENGILIRDGAAIQHLNEVDTILFDKTGTLTEGIPAITNIELTGSLLEDDCIRIAAAVEKHSTHPLGIALVELAKERSITLETVSDVKVFPGQGIQARYGSAQIKVGNRRFLGIEGKNIGQGTKIYLSVEHELTAVFTVEDTPKSESVETITKLQNQGITCVLITGDRTQPAEILAKSLNIKEVHAGVLPAQKANIVKAYQQAGKIVAMVGDGINDAPALAQADVGIALGSGTEIAIEAGSIILAKGNINKVGQAVLLAGKILNKIKQNLFWAIIYNLIAIPLAFAGVLHPVIAEIAMAFSSVNVVWNANRLHKISLG